MNNYIFTDLIMENSRIENFKEKDSEYSEQAVGAQKVCRLRVGGGENGAQAGEYITVFTPLMWEMGESERGECARVLAHELRGVTERAMGRKISPSDSFLIAGMGNRRISSDSVGALTAEGINVTRHVELISPKMLERAQMCCVCAVECGVLGDTGIRTSEVLSGLLGSVRPSAVIAVDALAARGYERLGRTVQISDTGISPGAGIGNRQTRLDKALLGVPVIAVGVPTVVSAATLVLDILGEGKGDKIEKKLGEASRFFVAPKECDLLSASAARIISEAINIMCGVEGNIF